MTLWFYRSVIILSKNRVVESCLLHLVYCLSNIFPGSELAGSIEMLVRLVRFKTKVQDWRSGAVARLIKVRSVLLVIYNWALQQQSVPSPHLSRPAGHSTSLHHSPLSNIYHQHGFRGFSYWNAQSEIIENKFCNTAASLCRAVPVQWSCYNSPVWLLIRPAVTFR